eukprot:1077560-Pyramimonas_sp.AAC.1
MQLALAGGPGSAGAQRARGPAALIQSVAQQAFGAQMQLMAAQFPIDVSRGLRAQPVFPRAAR